MQRTARMTVTVAGCLHVCLVVGRDRDKHPASRPHIPEPGDRLFTLHAQKLQIAGPQACAMVCQPLAVCAPHFLKVAPSVLNLFDRALTDLDHVRLRTSCVATSRRAVAIDHSADRGHARCLRGGAPRKVSPDVVTMLPGAAARMRQRFDRSKGDPCAIRPMQPPRLHLGAVAAGLEPARPARGTSVALVPPSGGERGGRGAGHPVLSPGRAATTLDVVAAPASHCLHAATARPTQRP